MKEESQKVEYKTEKINLQIKSMAKKKKASKKKAKKSKRRR